MYRQDKATTEKHTKMLRELVKRPENKLCADCKRNDARWASWNIGVFVCIRCSGFHRGMGTHISKVKSVDLDTWTPEQIQSVQRWGNHLANLYWEAHLRPGHSPPEHKMESFIRSKYESRRWAREGPPPLDPLSLENDVVGSSVGEASSTPSPAPVIEVPASPVAISPPRAIRQPQHHQLLSAATAGRSSPAQPMQVGTRPPEQPKVQQPLQATVQSDLFSLDFHAPSPAVTNQNRNGDAPQKDVKQDILSLFSSTPAASATTISSRNFGNPSVGAPQVSTSAVSDPFAQWGQPQAPKPQVTSMTGSSGAGMWGVQSGWSAPVVQAAPAQTNVWGGGWAGAASPHQQQPGTQGIFETQSVWGSSTGAPAANGAGTSDLSGAPFSTSSASSTQKKDDAFGDLWGDFK